MEITSYFTPLVWPLAIRAALWDGDAETARRLVTDGSILGFAGALIAADKLVARAGLAALEGQVPAAIADYREAFRAYRAIGSVFSEAVAAVDLAVLVPAAERAASDLDETIATARTTLTRLGAAPFLRRLDEALSGSVTIRSASSDERVPQGARVGS
jgi:hypothetical protein